MFKPAGMMVLVMSLWSVSTSAQMVEGEDLRDPTQPGQWKAATSSAGVPSINFRLNGILVGDDGRKQALINGKTLNVGDRVSGASVASIEADRVVLLLDGKQRVLRWKTSSGVKKVPASAGRQ